MRLLRENRLQIRSYKKIDERICCLIYKSGPQLEGVVN